MPTKVVVGAQWGDEGKGKIIDILAAKSDIVVRCQGGDNAGHTIKYKDKTYALRCIPSGILFPKVSCFISAGVVLNPKALILEMDELQNKGISLTNLKIDPRAHIIMPWHIALDSAYENVRDKNIGTTKKGIGPCYEDKMKRCGIRFCDIIDEEVFIKKAYYVGKIKNEILSKIYGVKTIDLQDMVDEYLSYGKRLKPFMLDISKCIYDAYNNKKDILFEGAQGTMLDINYGTYPFVTSSNPISGGVCTGVGIGPKFIDSVFGVAKAYTTRVGEGPFPSEMQNNLGDLIREKGGEFGTNTKRKRRIGWFDAVVIKHSKMLNGLDRLILNKLDILSGIDTLKICTAYKTSDGEILKDFPWSSEILKDVSPIYEELPGFSEDISHCKTVEELPTNCKNYILKIEKLCGLKINMIGVGPNRYENIHRDI